MRHQGQVQLLLMPVLLLLLLLLTYSTLSGHCRSWRMENDNEHGTGCLVTSSRPMVLKASACFRQKACYTDKLRRDRERCSAERLTPNNGQ
jgi:hypothetical protein